MLQPGESLRIRLAGKVYAVACWKECWFEHLKLITVFYGETDRAVGYGAFNELVERHVDQLCKVVTFPHLVAYGPKVTAGDRFLVWLHMQTDAFLQKRSAVQRTAVSPAFLMKRTGGRALRAIRVRPPELWYSVAGKSVFACAAHVFEWAATKLQTSKTVPQDVSNVPSMPQAQPSGSPRIRQPVVVADIACALNKRSDNLLRKLRAHHKPLSGKRPYAVELEDFCEVFPQFAARARRWYEGEYGG